MLHANFMAVCSTESELSQVEVLHCGNRDFRPFLLLWPWPWPDDLHINLYTNLTRIPWRYTGCTKINFLRQGFRKLSSDRHAYRQTWPEIIYHASSRVVINLSCISSCSSCLFSFSSSSSHYFVLGCLHETLQAFQINTFQSLNSSLILLIRCPSVTQLTRQEPLKTGLRSAYRFSLCLAIALHFWPYLTVQFYGCNGLINA